MFVSESSAGVAALIAAIPQRTTPSVRPALRENAALYGSPRASASRGLAVATQVLKSADSLTTSLLSGLLGSGSPVSSGRALSQPLSNEDKQLLHRADRLLEIGDVAQAKSIADAILERSPNSGDALHTRGAVELRLGRYADAEKTFHRAAFVQPNAGHELDAENARVLQQDDKAVLARARRLISTDDSRAAGKTLLETLVARSPGNGDGRLLLADVLVNSGEAASGLEQYQQVVDQGDDSQVATVEKRVEDLLRVAPDTAVLHNLLGQAQLKLGKTEDAAEHLATAARLAPENPDYKADQAKVVLAEGRSQLDNGDITGAISTFRRAQTLDPLSLDIRTGLAVGLAARADQFASRGNVRVAITTYRAAANELRDEGPDDLRSRIAAGAFRAGLREQARNLAEGNKVDREALAFQTAHDLDPTNATYRRTLAEARLAIGDQETANEKFDAAVNAYRRAYDLDPRNAAYKGKLIDGYTRLGDYKKGVRKYSEAVEAYKSAYDLDRSNVDGRNRLADAYYTRGQNYIERGKLSLAAQDFREAYSLDPSNDNYEISYQSYQAYL